MQNITILEGATGTELQRRGYKMTNPLWSASAIFDAPDLLKQIHKDYIKAGAQLITANTFRTNLHPWEQVGKPKMAKTATEKAVEIANQARQESIEDGVIKNINEVKIGGVIGMTTDTYNPKHLEANARLHQQHSNQVKFLSSLSIDFIMISTITDIKEALVILKYASKTDLPIYLSFVPNKDCKLWNGDSLETMLELITPYKVECLMLNCGLHPEEAKQTVEKFAQLYKGKKGIFLNGYGDPDDEAAWKFTKEHGPKEYLSYAKHWAEIGYTVIGACCGSTPAHIKALSKHFKQK